MTRRPDCERQEGTRPTLLGAISVTHGVVRQVSLGAVLGLALIVPVTGCAPTASSVPLGLGPLAIAERDSEAEAVVKQRREKKPARAARAGAADPAPAPEDSAADEASAVAKTSAADDKDEPSATTPPGAKLALEGLYSGSDIAVYRLTGFPEREEKDDKAKIRIDKAAAGSVSITLINTADGSDLCELTARVDGNAALIESAQPCFSDGSEGSIEAELTSGRAVIEGDRLKMDAEGTLSVSSADEELDGQMTYSFTGERQ